MVSVTINNHTTQLKGNDRALIGLDKRLTFRHPDSFFIKKKIGYHWDGMVHPLTKGGRIKTGLLQSAIDTLMEYEEEYEVLDYRKHLELKEVPTTIAGTRLYEHQVRAIESVVYNTVLDQPHPRGLVIAGVNAGKTLVMFGIHLAYEGAKTLMLVDNTALYNQMIKDAELVFGDKAGQMQGKKVKWGDFMVVMVKSLNNRLEDYKGKLKEYNILLVDEADLGTSATHQSVYQGLSHIPVRMGFTGTAFMRNLAKDKLRNNLLIEQFGSQLYEITMKELEDRGISTKTHIRILPGDGLRVSPGNFLDEFKETLVENPKRYARILLRVKYHLKRKRSGIIIFNRLKEQTERMGVFLEENLPNHRVAWTHSGEKGDALEKFKNQEVDILVCSLYLKRGLNIPHIKVVINNSAGEFYSNALQILGRGVRLHKDKDIVYFEDFFDTGDYLRSHSKRRISYYKSRNLSFEDLSRRK